MLLFNSGGVFLVSVALLTLVVFLYKKWKKHDGRLKQKTKAVIIIGGYMALVIVIGSFMLSDLQRPSTVDLSPFLTLEDIDFRNADDIINSLQTAQDELGCQFEILGTLKNAKGCVYYPENGIYFHVYVYFEVFDENYLAKDNFEIFRAKYSAKTAYEHIILSENIEALLFNSRVSRADGLGWYVISDRSVRTYVRIKNVTIEISETKRDGKDIGQASNKAIEKLCEILMNL